MPHTVTARTLILCNDLVTYIAGQWSPAAPSLVKRAYLHRIDLKNVKGRQVIVFPNGYTNNPADRGSDKYTHTVTILTFEKYEDAADPDVVVPEEWVDERVDFVNEFIAEGLDFTHDTTTRAGLAPFNQNLQTLSVDVPEIYDPERLEKAKEFWCAVELVFSELAI